MARLRVDGLLGDAWRRRVTLVVADAGYGKSTALMDLSDRGESRWLSLRPSDRDARVLVRRIEAALGLGTPWPVSDVAGPDDPEGAHTLPAAPCCNSVVTLPYLRWDVLCQRSGP
jgi:hypothetical protein